MENARQQSGTHHRGASLVSTPYPPPSAHPQRSAQIAGEPPVRPRPHRGAKVAAQTTTVRCIAVGVTLRASAVAAAAGVCHGHLRAKPSWVGRRHIARHLPRPGPSPPSGPCGDPAGEYGKPSPPPYGPYVAHPDLSYHPIYGYRQSYGPLLQNSSRVRPVAPNEASCRRAAFVAFRSLGELVQLTPSSNRSSVRLDCRPAW